MSALATLKPPLRSAAPARCPIHIVEARGSVDIPAGVIDYESFRMWARSADCAEKIHVAFYRGALWVDVSMEQLYFHNQVKAAFLAALFPMSVSDGNGRFFTDGVLLSNAAIGLSTIPDGVYVSHEAFETNRVREIPGAQNGFVELEGSPEIVLEVISDSSEDKDDIDLRDLYFESGIEEYWLVDVRSEPLRFEILRRGGKGFSAVRGQAGGWIKSRVFGRSFRLVEGADRRGRPLFTLEIR